MASSKASSSIIAIFTLLLINILLSLQFHVVISSKSPSPFEFVKHLQGSHRGDHAKGLHQLKQYLKRLGYLDHNIINDDVFDSTLESAIKTYQLNYNLNMSGHLDAKTASTMMLPRCGVPDIINGKTRMKSGKRKRQYANGTTVVESHYSFFQGRPKWPPYKYHLTYGFFQGTPDEAMSAVDRAFQTWAAYTHFTFSRASSGQNPDLIISFQRGNHGDGYPFDGPGGTLAHAFSPTDGRFHFDADEAWTIGAYPGYYDVETVAVHEIGHLLGLDHSSDPYAIMFPTIMDGATKGLGNDDVQGIRDLYNYA